MLPSQAQQPDCFKCNCGGTLNLLTSGQRSRNVLLLLYSEMPKNNHLGMLCKEYNKALIEDWHF